MNIKPIETNKKKSVIESLKAIFLSGTFDHYFTFLPKKIGLLFKIAFGLLFDSIPQDDHQTARIRKLENRNGVIVIVTKYRSLFQYFFFYTRYKKLGLPYPQVGFNYRVILFQPVIQILRGFLAKLVHFFRYFSLPDPYESGFYRDKLLGGSAGIVSLLGEKMFYRRFVKADKDPLQFLIELQQTTDRPVLIVPHLFFFSKRVIHSNPTLVDILFGSQEKPGRLRSFYAMIRHPGTIFYEVSKPLSLLEFIHSPEHRDLSPENQARLLRRQLITQINRHHRSVIGPILKTRTELMENILTQDEFQKFISDHAASENIPIQKARKQATGYLDEIAANFSNNWIRIFDIVLTWMLNNLFEGMIVDQEGLKRVKKIGHKAPLILIPCHKSHLDYLIFSYVMYHNNMPCPHIAAGKNLSFWPLGTIFRGGGAFFLRRSFKGQELYAKAFSSYVEKLLWEGFNIEFFIEGGRSRTGKVLMPKFGLLSILLNAFRNNACEDMIFVPINIAYDRVLEDQSYVDEIEGGQKEPESLKQVFKASRLLKKRYGKVYINFNEPFSLSDYLRDNGIDIAAATHDQIRDVYNRLGFYFINAINEVTIVTPHAIVAAALLNSTTRRCGRQELMAHIETYMNFLATYKRRIADTLLVDRKTAFDQVFDIFMERKFIEPSLKNIEPNSDDMYYNINISARPALDYYKNTSIIYFIPGAMTALAILEKDAFLFSCSDLHDGYRFLQGFFNNEFAYDVQKTVEYQVRKALKAFIDDAVVIPHPTMPDTYNLTSSGFRKLKWFSHFLKPYLEAYWVVLNYFKQTAGDDHEPKDGVKRMQALGQRMLKKNEIDLFESISKITFKNAETYFLNHGVRGSEDTERIAYYSDRLSTCLRLLR